MYPIDPNALRQQADELEKAGKALLDAGQQMRAAANVLSGLSQTNGKPTTSTFVPTVNPTLGAPRLEQLRTWLKEHGPMRRKEVLASCGLPPGTVSVLLKEKNFSKDQEGRWYVPEALEIG